MDSAYLTREGDGSVGDKGKRKSGGQRTVRTATKGNFPMKEIRFNEGKEE